MTIWQFNSHWLVFFADINVLCDFLSVFETNKSTVVDFTVWRDVDIFYLVELTNDQMKTKKNRPGFFYT